MPLDRLLSQTVHAVREVDRRWSRQRHPQAREIVFDARTAMEYAMMSPVHRRLLADPRVQTWLMSSERPGRVADIFRDAPPGARIISPRRAWLKRFDAYLAADFVWATLPRGTKRVQMFHGVAGKWSHVYDRPLDPMHQWDRLFFINRRRLQNFITYGAIAADSPAIRLIGMPKCDRLVDGSVTRDGVLRANGIEPSRTTVLYAPTWTQYSSLNAMGEAVVEGLIRAGYQVLVKLHENSRDRRVVNSGGVDWRARLQPILASGHGHFIETGDAASWMVAADVLITDHSSIGFEYLLLDRPLIRINMPELITRADIPAEYVDLIADASTTVNDAAGAVAAVARSLENPAVLSASRRWVAEELFHDAGRATDRAMRELYDLIALEAPVTARAREQLQAVATEHA